MTQTVTGVSAPQLIPSPPGGMIKRTTDDAIAVGQWSTPIACSGDDTFTATPGSGGTISVQVSLDSGLTWGFVRGIPFSSASTNGIPTGATHVRATAAGAVGTLIVDSPVLAEQAQIVTSYTAAELSALAAAGGLTPWASYAESNTGRAKRATRADTLQPVTNAGAWANDIGQAMVISPGLSVNTNGNKQLCSFVKLTAPGEFWAVRVVFRNHSTDAGGATLFGCVVAATETAVHTDKSTTGALTFQPRVSGASVNTLDSSADAYGWRTVTWSGSSTPTIAAATSSTQPTTLRSDWIPLKSVPRIDSGETLPLLLLRFGYNNTNPTTASYIATGSTGIDRTAGNMGRVIQAYFVTDATGVYTTAPQSNTPSSGFNDTMATVGVEFMLVQSARSIWFIGDSTVGGNTIPADKFNTWGWQACALLQDTYGVACSPVNYGYSSQAAATYWDKNAKQYLPTHKPHIAVYQVCGHNDYSGATTAALTRVITQRCMGKAMEFVQNCRDANIIPVLLTSPGDASITTAAADAERLALNTAIRSMPVPYIDMAALLDDTASPARILAAYNNGDDIHPSIAGIAAQGALAARVLSGLM